MVFRALFTVLFAALSVVGVNSIGHDKVQPFAQPEPITDSENTGVKFKPQLKIVRGCASYAAVNAAGEITGGLKGTGYTSGCKEPRLGSQVYGRASWREDVWAIMYAWYFPKGFVGDISSRRHDWASAVVWIDNPALKEPKILGVSTSTSDSKYDKRAFAPTFAITNSTTVHLNHATSSGIFGSPYLECAATYGEFQDLVMWEQLTEAARTALDTADFGDAKVPFIDANFAAKLEAAWPF
ncbi:hypothetical protein PHYBOEH_001808 [Phytophthora boehmeriae]|uniref:Necrosis inducing-like protein NPP1 type n=1 Tax=Phytophthora boehmeriae TaxID=109152 RepID=A0A8T1WYI3_9STRA|nr:hypothetical protein PHYBOEH_001808 [Phytophthora boehmeriae]